jgi:protein TonB
MFETADLGKGPSTKRVWATLVGFTGQVVLVACALIAPLIWPQVIPRVAGVITIAAPPTAPGEQHPQVARVEPRRSAVSTPSRHAFVEPRLENIPARAPTIVDEPQAIGPSSFIPGSLPGDPSGGIPGGLPLALVGPTHLRPNPPVPPRVDPPPTPTAPVAAPRRISVVELARPIHRVEPIYPRLAVISRLQGTVRLMGVLGTDGRIREIKVLAGHPLLVQAAVDAVKQWVYAPTTLNGEPVEVQAPIEVNFILNR